MCGWEWFPDNKGLVSGLVVGGYGFGAFIFGFVSTHIANPDNHKPDPLYDESVAKTVPHMYRLMLIYWTALGLCAVIGVSRNPTFVREEEIRNRTLTRQKTLELINNTERG